VPHPKKILSQAGISLADQYDIEGSVAGVEELDSESVKTVHEMGATIFSERLGGLLRRSTTGAIAQNITFGDVLNLPNISTRIYGIQVITDDPTRLSRVVVHARDQQATVQEHPIWVWDTVTSVSVPIVDAGVLATHFMLSSLINIGVTSPIMLFGTTSDSPISQLAFRGLTAGFGAGTVTVTALIYHGFSQLGGISSYGVALPSW